jgi:XisI protein
MARLEQYRHLIQRILTQYAQIPPAYGEIERQTIFDTERDHYQLVNTGWENHRRVYGCLIHIDIRDEKFWVQYDGTEAGVANQLVELGVPKQDIVLAFQSPFMRQLTEFAVG